jgi:aquaporin Z
MASAAIARLPLLLALGLAPFARTSAKDVTAKFEAANPSAASVRGTVTFSQPTAGAPVQVSVTLAGLQHGPNSWYIHSYPVTGQDCSNSSVGVQSQQLGDLTGSSVTKVATDSDITLFGPGSIVGRSIVLHKSTALGGSRWACATIGQARAVTASFTKDSEAAGPLRGYITFTQVEDGPAVVDVSLNGLVYGPNAWHVHKWPVTGGDCSDSSVSGHYNPTGFDGELEMRHSSLPNVPHFKAQYIDTELTLFGSASIVGRSIVIHKASVGAPRWVCATIGEARTVTATFAHSEPASQSVRGAVVFTQVEHGPTVVDVRLAGLDHGGAAGNPWHVHSFPVTDGQCSATSVGGHYNPTGRPTQGELSLNLGNLQYTAAASVMDQQVWKQYVDDAITLFGPDSIVGRSVVIHKNDATKSRWACTTIGEKKVVTALFTDQPSSTDGGIFGGSTVPTDGSGSIYSRPSAAGPVRGTVTFSQVQHGITMIDVQLAGLEHGPNPWHIHEFAGTGADCSAASVGGHYNPPDHPTQGELSTLMGDLRVTSGPADIVTAHTAVTGVTLFGDESIIGRSIVIHKQNGARWVCATIGTDEVQIQRPPQSVREKVTVLFSDDGLAIGLVVTILVLCLLIFLLHVCNTRRAGRDVTTDEMRLRDKVERLERYVDTRLSVFCLVDHRGARITTEFVGTMILAVTVALTGKRSPIAPLAIGFSLMVGIYSGGHISGAHYNPAVTLAMVVRGVMGVQDAMLYVVAQLGGAWFGTLLGFVIVGERNSAYPAKGVNVDNFDAWLAELVLTFALSFTVLNVTTSRAQANNSYFGMAIGFVVISGAISVGGISGGAFNPAIGAMCLMHGEFDDLWIYWSVFHCW